MSQETEPSPAGEAPLARTAAVQAARGAVAFDRAGVSARAGFVAAIPVAGMLALGTAVGQPIAAVTMAVGAMLVGVAWRAGGGQGGGPIDPPVGTMTAAALSLTFATAAGTISGRWPWLHLGLLAVFCLIAGSATSLGRRGAVPGTQSVIAFVVFGRFPEPVTGGLTLAGLVLLGGAAQILVATVLARPAAYRAQRQALAGAYRSLADQAASLQGSAVPAAGALDAADTRLSAPALFADPALLSLSDLVAEGRRIRLELISLHAAVDGLARGAVDGPSGGAGRILPTSPEQFDPPIQAVERALAPLVRVLRLIAERLGESGTPQDGLLDAQSMLHEYGETRARLEDVDPTGHGRLDDHLDAVIGQVTAAAQLAAGVGGGGHALRHARPSRGTPVPLQGLRADLRRLRAAATLQSTAGRHALRLAVVVAGTELLIQRVALPRGYWAVVAAATVLRPDFGATFTRGAERMLGTLGGVLIASFLVVALDPGGWGITGVVVALAWLTYSVFGASYAAGTAGLTAVVVFLLRAASPDSVTIALDRGLDTLIGGTIGLIAYALWPTWSGRMTGTRLAEVVADQRLYLEAVLAAVLAGRRADDDELRPLARRARIAWSDAEAAVTLARVEPVRRGAADPATAGATLAALRRVIHAIHSLRVDAREPTPASEPELASEPAPDRQSEPHHEPELNPEPELAGLARAFRSALLALEARLRDPNAPVTIPALRARLPGPSSDASHGSQARQLILDELIDAIDSAAVALHVPLERPPQRQPLHRV